MSKETVEWEYEIRYDTPILTSNKSTHQDRLNEMGNEGWELASFVQSDQLVAFSIFKRPKPIPSTPK